MSAAPMTGVTGDGAPVVPGVGAAMASPVPRLA